jgi:ABC-type polysaccharide/polyol phosphate transport system ATPase subunit
MRTVIQAIDLSKQYILRHNHPLTVKERTLEILGRRRHQATTEAFWALRNINLSIGAGDSVGLVGRNGSGKSTLLRLIAGILTPTSGRLLVARGARIVSQIELGVGFHLELTGRENVMMNAAIHGLSQAQSEAIYADVVEFSGLGHFMDVPLLNYSSGMHVRLGFAVAANLQPDILLLDEILAVGDQEFQKRCFAMMERMIADGRTIVFVSHDPNAVAMICRRVCVLHRGRLMFDGPTQDGLHEYERLLASVDGEEGWAASGQSARRMGRP